MCGGHGDCVCGTCQCLPGFTGPACECPISQETCIAPNGKMCGGHGWIYILNNLQDDLIVKANVFVENVIVSQTTQGHIAIFVRFVYYSLDILSLDMPEQVCRI